MNKDEKTKLVFLLLQELLEGERAVPKPLSYYERHQALTRVLKTVFQNERAVIPEDEVDALAMRVAADLVNYVIGNDARI